MKGSTLFTSRHLGWSEAAFESSQNVLYAETVAKVSQ